MASSSPLSQFSNYDSYGECSYTYTSPLDHDADNRSRMKAKYDRSKRYYAYNQLTWYLHSYVPLLLREFVSVSGRKQLLLVVASLW